MFAWLETTGLASFVDNSPWAYPFLLTVHGLGMAVVVGLTVMMAVRVLGFPTSAPLGAYRDALPWLSWAFAINALSGMALFVADAVALSENKSFQIKLLSIAVGLLVLARLFSTVILPAQRAEAQQETFVPPRSAKALAIAAIALWWLSVIVSGRLVAYLAAAV